MDERYIEQAAGLLIAAHRSGTRLDALPIACQPATVEEAHAIQDRMIAALGEPVAGWKLAFGPDGSLIRGPLLASRVFLSPAQIDPGLVPLLGAEAEIAFRFDRPLPPRVSDYDYEEVADAVTAFAAIEIVDSRFISYQEAPFLHRLADFMSNGAFIKGLAQPNWRDLNLSELHVNLCINGTSIVDHHGGHSSRDPLLPAVAFVNNFRKRSGVLAGQVVTTGTYTGLNFAKPGQSIEVSFIGFDSVKVFFK